jgi:hypothetical protein
MFFGRLAEEVKDFGSDVAERRRRELLAGLNSEFSNLLSFLVGLAQVYITNIAQQPNTDNGKVAILLMERILTTLQQFVEWASIKLIFSTYIRYINEY